MKNYKGVAKGGRKCSVEEIQDMMQEALENLADPKSEISDLQLYDYPAQVPSRWLKSALTELLELRSKLK